MLVKVLSIIYRQISSSKHFRYFCGAPEFQGEVPCNPSGRHTFASGQEVRDKIREVSSAPAGAGL